MYIERQGHCHCDYNKEADILAGRVRVKYESALGGGFKEANANVRSEQIRLQRHQAAAAAVGGSDVGLPSIVVCGEAPLSTRAPACT